MSFNSFEELMKGFDALITQFRMSEVMHSNEAIISMLTN